MMKLQINQMCKVVVDRLIKETRKIYSSYAIRDKDISLISNNCIGADICHTLGLRFNSPTVNMQILPEDYTRFVSELPGYLNEDIVEHTVFSENENKKIARMFGVRGGMNWISHLGFAGIYYYVFSTIRHFRKQKKCGIVAEKELIGISLV